MSDVGNNSLGASLILNTALFYPFSSNQEVKMTYTFVLEEIKSPNKLVFFILPHFGVCPVENEIHAWVSFIIHTVNVENIMVVNFSIVRSENLKLVFQTIDN